MTIKIYSELLQLTSFDERFDYLTLRGTVGKSTFGFDRYLNQRFYTSKEWRDVRNEVIIRDNGCDLGMSDYLIFGKIIIHHMNPIKLSDLEKKNIDILNPEFLICTSIDTHNAIHFGDKSKLKNLPPDRKPGDTLSWTSFGV